MKFNSEHKEIILRFIVRRAFRHGATSRADLMNAFNLSSASATRTMTEAIVKLGNLLKRTGHNLIPKPLMKPPSYASEADLLESLDAGKSDVTHTGLFETELPITYVSWTNSIPPEPGVLQLLIDAIGKRRQIDIVYLDLHINNEPEERKILPLGLEKMNGQWRVIAQDLGNPTFPVEMFVLSRILLASISTKIAKISFIKGHTDSQSSLKVMLNYRYSSQQKNILERELNVKNGIITIGTRALHEFKRLFATTPMNPNTIWPPLTIKDE